MIPDPTLVLFVYTCTVQAIVCLGATSIAQGRTALAHKSVVLPKGFMNTMPASVQALARQHGVSTLDAITDAETTVAATHRGVAFVRPTIEPTNAMTLYGRRIPHIASHVFLNLQRALKKRTMQKSNWYAVTPLRVGGAHCGALDAGLFRRRPRFFFAHLSSESVAVPTYDKVPELKLATTPSSESLTRRPATRIALVPHFMNRSFCHAATLSGPLSLMVQAGIADCSTVLYTVWAPEVQCRHAPPRQSFSSPRAGSIFSRIHPCHSSHLQSTANTSDDYVLRVFKSNVSEMVEEADTL